MRYCSGIWIMRQLTDSYGGLRQNGDARYPQGTSGFQLLASFAAYAQNRNFEATTVFANAVRRVPVKKKAIQPRTIFTLSEVSVLLRLPDPENALDSVTRFF